MAARLLDLSSHWCILRCAGPRTLRLADSLARAGIETWTPRAAIRRPVPGAKPDGEGRRPTHELPIAIVPGFVFARARHLADLAALARDQANAHIASAHPPFTVHKPGVGIPFFHDRQIAVMKAKEAEEAAKLESRRAAKTARAARLLHIAGIRDAVARKRAATNLAREERRLAAAEQAAELGGGSEPIAAGDTVEVTTMAAMAGVKLTVDERVGDSARLWFGSLKLKIDAWQLAPPGTDDPAPAH